MGIDKAHFITTENIEETAKKWSRKFDLIVVTKYVSRCAPDFSPFTTRTSNQKQPPIVDLYVPLLKPHGKIVFVGLGEDLLPALPPTALTGKAVSIGGSPIGSPQQIKVRACAKDGDRPC
jgi:alcohol dehydrogenase (NADP+)